MVKNYYCIYPWQIKGKKFNATNIRLRISCYVVITKMKIYQLGINVTS